MPTTWYNLVADLPEPPPPPLHPGTHEPIGPEALEPLFPMGPDPAGGRRPSGTSRSPARCWTSTGSVAARAAAPGSPARGVARDHGADLLQVRGRQPGRLAQGRTPPCRRRTTTPRRACSKLTTETGAGQWGTALSFATRPVRPGVRGVAGRGLVRPEALPPDDDRGVRRHPCTARRPTSRRPARHYPGQADPNHPGSLGIAISEAVEAAVPDPEREVRPGFGAQPRASCTRRSSARRRCSRWPRPARTAPDVIIGLHRRRLELRRPDVPDSSGRSWPGG